ncbi:branched-chain amino acid ABC transporter permease [Thermosipho ferrireducens]|uniref:Branched-chain amino acid ABC transporter permease n=1 Tax=Thermosipho ferrireducens TaxID=2571116 RepID=A0ABX7S8K8_9BACT|nr:branched-chain amino acid ABC transporter permease [Thermosipho ferrireducens]QTA37440.1 branched-chain amino acid ABC transporter permease [Thermosipho ferrireducens]
MINQILLGLSTGAIYSLVALGLVMIYKITGVVNFAFGNMGMFFVYIAYWFISMNVNFWIGIIFSLILAGVMGYFLEKFGLRSIRHLSHGSMLIVTFGVLMVLEGLAVQIWGTDYKTFPEIIKGRPYVFRGDFGILVLRKQDVLIFALLIMVSILIFFLMKYTKFGIAIRAVSENEEISSYMGINVGKIFSFSWIFGTVVATGVGILVAPKTFVSPSMLLFYQLEGFTAAVLGGFESFTGAIFGGLLLGVLENLVGKYISNDLKSTFSLLLIIVVLLLFPNGIFGMKKRERV